MSHSIELQYLGLCPDNKILFNRKCDGKEKLKEKHNSANLRTKNDCSNQKYCNLCRTLYLFSWCRVILLHRVIAAELVLNTLMSDVAGIHILHDRIFYQVGILCSSVIYLIEFTTHCITSILYYYCFRESRNDSVRSTVYNVLCTAPTIPMSVFIIIIIITYVGHACIGSVQAQNYVRIPQ